MSRNPISERRPSSRNHCVVSWIGEALDGGGSREDSSTSTARPYTVKGGGEVDVAGAAAAVVVVGERGEGCCVAESSALLPASPLPTDSAEGVGVVGEGWGGGCARSGLWVSELTR